MSKDTIKVNMNVYDIPILVEQLKKLEQENKQLKEDKKKVIEYIYLHSTQRKWFANVSDRLHNQEIQFKGRIEDLLEILEDK